MRIRPKTKRRLVILALGVIVLIGGAVGVYLRFVQKQNAKIAASRSAAMSAYAAGDYAAALPHFDRYLTLSKTAERGAAGADTEALFAYGKSRASIELANQRHLWEAKNVFERYLMLKPGDEPAERMLLEIYPRLNHNQEAVTLADEVLARRPGDVPALKAKTEALLQKGLSQQDARAFEQAREAGEKLIAAAPDDLDGHLLTQFAMANAKAPADEVVARAKALTDARPNDPRFELVLASAYLYANDVPKARELLRTAAARKAPDAKYVNELVTRLDALGLFRESLAAMERAAADLGGAEGGAALARTLVQRQWQDGRYNAVLQRLDGVDPRDTKSDATLLGVGAMTLLQHGQKERAAAILDALGARGTSDSAAFAWSTAVKAVFLADAPGPGPSPATGPAATGPARPATAPSDEGAAVKEMVQKLKSALEKDPANPFFHYFLAGCYKRLGERTLAIDALTQAARRAPAWAEPRQQAASMLADEGRYADAVRVAEDAYRRDRNDLQIVVVWAESAFRLLETSPDQKELDRLLKTVEEIRRFAPREPNTLPILAAVLARAGQADRAADVVRSALAADPPPAPAVLERLAAVSREAGLGLDDEIARRLRAVAMAPAAPGGAATGPGAALAAAIERFNAGRAAEGLELLNAARANAGAAGNELPWRLAVAQYLDAVGDVDAVKQWVELGDAFPRNLTVQTAALRARSRLADRDFWKRTIERVKELTVENSQLWRLEEARYLLSGELKKEQQASVQATLTELARNAPYSAEPRRLLAYARERAASAPGVPPQEQQSLLGQAVTAMQQACDLRPTDVATVADLARLLRLAGRADEAVRYFDRAAARPNLDRLSRLRLAELYAAHGQPRKAIDLAGPLGDDVAPRLARWHRALGEDREAEAVYLKLLDRAGDGAASGTEVGNGAPAARLDAQTVLDAATFFGERKQPEQAEKFLAKLDGMRLQPGARELIRAKYAERFAPQDAARLYAGATAAPGAAAGVWREAAGYHLRRRDLAAATAAADAGLKAHAGDTDLLAMKQRTAELAPLAQDPAAQALFGYLSFDPRNRAANDMLAVLRSARAARATVEETVANFRAAADRHPNFLPLQVAAARAHLRAGEPQQAELVARRAAATFPDDVEAVRLLAGVYAAAGKWAELRDTAAAWRRLTPNDTLGPDLLLARAQLNANDPSGAAERLAPHATAEADRARRGDAEDVNGEVVDVYARALIAEARADDAAALLEPLARSSARWRRAWLDLAGAFRSRDLEAAAAWVTRVEPLVPADAPRERCQLAGAWYVVGREFADREALANARRMVQPLTATPEVAADAWTILAACDEGLGDSAAAERAYRKALELRPNHPDVMNNLAFVLLLKGDGGSVSKAEELARKAIAAAPSVGAYHDTLARIQVKQGFSDAAMTSFRRALDLDAANIEAMIGMADVLTQQGKRDQARQQLTQIETALKISPRLAPGLAKQLETVRTSLQTPNPVQSGRVE